MLKLQEPSEDAEAEDGEDAEGASEGSQSPVNDLYDDQGVLMCQMDTFIDLRSMLPGAELSRLTCASAPSFVLNSLHRPSTWPMLPIKLCCFRLCQCLQLAHTATSPGQLACCQSQE